MTTRAAFLLTACTALCAAAASVQAATEASGFETWWARMNAEIKVLVEASRPVPPTPVPLTFRARRIWSGKFSGELLGLAAADLSGDGQDELVALTTDSLFLMSRRRGLFDVRLRVAGPAKVAKTRSRSPIGLISFGEMPTADALVSEVIVRARSSEQGAGGVYAWRGGTLVLASEFAGYPLCENGSIRSQPRRNEFSGVTALWPGQPGPNLGTQLQSVGCSRGLVAPNGTEVRYVSEVSARGTLAVHCAGDATACELPTSVYNNVGYAHLVSDLDNDGRPEVAVTAAVARGGADRVQVFSQVGHERQLRFERTFERGIHAMAAGDFDGDGALELLVAERQEQAGRVSLWLLN